MCQFVGGVNVRKLFVPSKLSAGLPFTALQ
jgi:hypothetical protein